MQKENPTLYLRKIDIAPVIVYDDTDRACPDGKAKRRQRRKNQRKNKKEH